MPYLTILQIVAHELAGVVKSRRRYISDYHSGVYDGRVIELVFILRSYLPSVPLAVRRLVGQNIRGTLNLDSTK